MADKVSLATLALAKAYTDESIEGAGAIKGKNCQIQSIEPKTGGNRVTFAWYDGSDVLKSGTMDVMDGEDGDKGDPGKGIKSMAINAQNHLIITYDDDTTQDAGLVPSGGGGEGDMKKSVYDNDLAVLNAGGIKAFVSDAISGKVDKVEGKGLSENDYTDADKSVVSGVTEALNGKQDALTWNGNYLVV